MLESILYELQNDDNKNYFVMDAKRILLQSQKHL